MICRTPRACYTIIFISALTTLIAIIHCSSMKYISQREKMSDFDVTTYVLQLDQTLSGFKNDILYLPQIEDLTLYRRKRISSLSVMNSVDVLRQRVLLELVRRKALQDQRQIDENRRLLESIGKRTPHGL